MIAEVNGKTRKRGKRSSLETLEWLLYTKFGRDGRLDAAREQYQIAEQASGEHTLCVDNGDTDGANEQYWTRRLAETHAWDLFNQVQVGDNISAAERLLGKVPEGHGQRKSLSTKLEALKARLAENRPVNSLDNFGFFRKLKDDSLELVNDLEPIVQEIEWKKQQESARALFDYNVAEIGRVLALMPQLVTEHVSVELQRSRYHADRTIFFFRVKCGSRTVKQVLDAIRTTAAEDPFEAADASFGLLRALEYRAGCSGSGNGDNVEADASEADCKKAAAEREAREKKRRDRRDTDRDIRNKMRGASGGGGGPKGNKKGKKNKGKK